MRPSPPYAAHVVSRRRFSPWDIQSDRSQMASQCSVSTNGSFDVATRRKPPGGLNLRSAFPENSCHQSKRHQLVKSAPDGTGILPPDEPGNNDLRPVARIGSPCSGESARPHKPRPANCGRSDTPPAETEAPKLRRIHRQTLLRCFTPTLVSRLR